MNFLCRDATDACRAPEMGRVRLDKAQQRDDQAVRRRRKPAVVELVLLAAGVSLLVAFFHFRAGQQALAEAGIEAFSSLVAPASASTATAHSPATPDQSLWSDERIAAYAESVSVGGDLPLAILAIDRLSIRVPVYNGADEHNLNRGVARVKGTARVSHNTGNLAIAGHRDGFFRALKDINNNEIIELTTPRGLVEYRVVSTQIVDPSDTHVLAPTEEKTLTLVTCYPFYFVGDAPRRFIVQAVAQPHSET